MHLAAQGLPQRVLPVGLTLLLTLAETEIALRELYGRVVYRVGW